MTTCPLCAHAEIEPILVRAGVPVLQNAPAITRELARARPRGVLSLGACTRCGFVFNTSFEPALVAYSESYDNTQSYSPQFETYLEDLARGLVDRHDLHGKRIVEVGCGKGHFLRLLCRIGGNRGFGFDTTYEGPDTVDDGAVRFVRELYSAAQRVEHTDFVCCRHVLEHVPDPVAMLGAVASAIDHAPDVGVFFEVPTLDWIIANDCIWDLFYEHCNYFTAATLARAFSIAGFAPKITPAFGGQYLWCEAQIDASATVEATSVESSLEAMRAFARRHDARVEALRELVRERAGDGGLAIWGAGAKGVTLANLVDPEAALVRYVVDINPNKQGAFIPGTGTPIVGPAALTTDRVRHVIGTNPNYRAEIEASVASLDLAFHWL
jgi:SAM-dependent methyltransferase